MTETVTPLSETVSQIVRSRSSTHTREQRSNLRAMHLHHRTDRFYSGSYTRTVSSLRQPTTKHRRSLSDGVREN